MTFKDTPEVWIGDAIGMHLWDAQPRGDIYRMLSPYLEANPQPGSAHLMGSYTLNHLPGIQDP